MVTKIYSLFDRATADRRMYDKNFLCQPHQQHCSVINQKIIPWTIRETFFQTSNFQMSIKVRTQVEPFFSVRSHYNFSSKRATYQRKQRDPSFSRFVIIHLHGRETDWDRRHIMALAELCYEIATFGEKRVYCNDYTTNYSLLNLLKTESIDG